MDAACNQLLAGARLAHDQDGGAGRRDLLDLAEHRREGGALAHEILESLLRLDLFVQHDVLGLEPVAQL